MTAAILHRPKVRGRARRLSALPLFNLWPTADGTPDFPVIAAVYGVNRASLYYWLRRGVTLPAADAAACRIGLHPSAVWGGEWWAANDAGLYLEPGEVQRIDTALPKPQSNWADLAPAGFEGPDDWRIDPDFHPRRQWMDQVHPA